MIWTPSNSFTDCHPCKAASNLTLDMELGLDGASFILIETWG